MKPLHTFFILLLLSQSCTSRSEKPDALTPQAATPTDTSTKAPPETRAQRFQRFLSMLPTQSLPLRLTCGVNQPSIRRDSIPQFSEFMPKNTDNVVAKMENKSKDFHTILFSIAGDDIVPRFYTFDKEGNYIDSLESQLFGCGADGESRWDSYFYFETNNQIRLLDTSWYWNGDLVEFKDSKFDSIVVSEENYLLNRAGKFIKQKK